MTVRELACLLRTTRLDGRAAVRAYGADPADLRTFLAARGLQGTWVLTRALRFPAEADAAHATPTTWLQDPSGERRG